MSEIPGSLATAISDYGDDRFAAGAASRDGEVTAAEKALAEEVAAHAADRTALAAALKRIEELLHTGPVERLPFGIGINEKAMSSALPQRFTRAQLESQAGVRFAYIREYSRYVTSGIDNALVAFCDSVLARGSNPVVSSKLPGDDWAGAANGRYDVPIDATEDALQGLVVKYRDKGFKRARVIRAVHHEMDNGDGSLAAYNAMIEHLLPIIRRPGDIEFWLNFTGYAQIFQAASEEFTFEKTYRQGIDGYAIDPYQSTFQKPANTSRSTFTDLPSAYLKPLADFCDAKGIQKGVWETGLTVLAQASTKPEAKIWIPHNAGGAAELGYTMWIYWNNNNPNSGNDWTISDIMPANTRSQMVAEMKHWAWV